MPQTNDLISAAIPDIAGDQNAIQDKMCRFYIANGAVVGDIEDERYGILVALNQTQVYGANQITDPFFANTALWTKGTGWTVNAGRARCDGTNVADSFLTFTAPNIAAGLTQLSITINAVSGGFLELQVNGVVYSSPLSTTGLTTLVVTVTAGQFRIKATPGTVCTVTGVSARAVTTVGPGTDKSTIQDLWSAYLRNVKGYPGAFDDQRPAYWAGVLP